VVHGHLDPRTPRACYKLLVGLKKVLGQLTGHDIIKVSFRRQPEI